jgi:hypothetical protein
MLTQTQILSLEIDDACNLSSAHKSCPSAVIQRAGPPLSEDIYILTAVSAYKEYHFDGMIAFHWYNEPMLAAEKMLRVMKRIRSAVPNSRFLLWTNGTILNRQVVPYFERVCWTNYGICDEKAVTSCYQGILNEIPGQLDSRIQNWESNRYSRMRCYRPLFELPVDSHGNVRLCCHDWRGDIFLGSLWMDDLNAILLRRLDILERICARSMRENAPRRCLHCNLKLPLIYPFDSKIAEEARRWSNLL